MTETEQIMQLEAENKIMKKCIERCLLYSEHGHYPIPIQLIHTTAKIAIDDLRKLTQYESGKHLGEGTVTNE